MIQDSMKAITDCAAQLVCPEVGCLKIDTSLSAKRQIIFGADSPKETELVLGDNFEIVQREDR